jgi:hypothetical protein
MIRHSASVALACALSLVDPFSSRAAEARGDALSANVTAGLTLEGAPVRFALLETRAEVTSHVTLAAGMAYVGAGGGYEELQFRALATGTITVRRWIIQNRHMFSLGSESAARYRNRLLVMRPGLFGHGGLSVRAFHELYVDLDRGRLIRNSLAFGVGTQLGNRLSAELYQVWVDNRDSPARDYVLVFVTWRIGS